MLGFRTVQRADIDDDLRANFELYGETALSLMLTAGGDLNVSIQGQHLIDLVKTSRPKMLEWLREQRDIAANHDRRVEILQWAILVFVFMEVVFDVQRMLHG